MPYFIKQQAMTKFHGKNLETLPECPWLFPYSAFRRVRTCFLCRDNGARCFGRHQKCDKLLSNDAAFRCTVVWELRQCIDAKRRGTSHGLFLFLHEFSYSMLHFWESFPDSISIFPKMWQLLHSFCMDRFKLEKRLEVCQADAACKDI